MKEMKRNRELNRRAREAWEQMSPLRGRRERYKSFAYGRQWGDAVCVADGRISTEGEAYRMQGRNPVTNNLIRQLLKTIIGRYRYLLSSDPDSDNDEPLVRGMASPLGELDSRGLEEFLISGMAIQRVECGKAENVSPARIFFSRFMRPDGEDCTFIGCLHDFSVPELMRRFSHGKASRAGRILAGCGNGDNGVCVSPGEPGAGEEYSRSGSGGRVRIIEVWEKKGEMTYLLHDRLKGEYGRVAWTEDSEAGVNAINASRRKRRLAEIEGVVDCEDYWIQSWLTPSGDVLEERRVRATEGCHPFVMRMYPYIDGEIHSLVEDVVGQQKYVNRLVSLLDDIIAQSGKGVLLFPSDQLPEGFTWGDLRRLWANPGGIVPYRRTSRTLTPQQIHSSGRSEGAAEMLKLQLKMFDEVAGVAGTLRGQTSGTRGAESMRRELENSTIGMLDILGAYREFTLRRDERLRQTLTKNENEKRI